MRFLTKFYTVVLVIVISVLFIIMFVIKDFVLMMDENANLKYIPNNAFFAARINTSELIKLSTEQLLTTQDAEIKEQLKKLDLSSGDQTFNGINFTSNVYMFIIPFENEYVEGFLFNLTDDNLFEQFYLKDNKYAGAANKEVGIIFLRDLKTLSTGQLNNLLDIAKQIAEKEQNSKTQINFPNSNAIISTWSTDVSGGLPYSNNLDLNFQTDKITLNGIFRSQTDMSEGWNYLKRKGISFHTSLIPGSINDTINKLYKSLEKNDSIVIKSISLNYEGVNFEQSDKLSIVPKMELLVNFQKEVNKDSLLQPLERNKLIQLSDSNRFIFNEIAFTVTQSEPNQLLIYTGNFPSQIEVRNELLEFSGDPSLLFKVGGNSPYGQFLNFIPLFRGGRQLTEATEYVNLKIRPGDKGLHQVDGVMQFKKGKSPILELIKFMNNAALLK